jgi:multicomponent K+:H+ antiporter subunit G
MSELALPPWAVIPAAVLLVCGGLLALIGALGLLRMPDFFSRVHPPAMGTTLGTGCVLLTSMLVSSVLQQRAVLHEALIALLLAMSAPITTMLLMRAAVTRRKKSSGD